MIGQLDLQASLLPAKKTLQDRAAELFENDIVAQRTRTARVFAGLLLFEWIGGVVAAFLISPYTWDGAASAVHPHVWTACAVGALVISLPLVLIRVAPAATSTRHVLAFAQMIMSGLLIQISGGRIETHFHVFGSLAFLAFFKDWRVLLTASVTIACDHLIRGIVAPATVYGISNPEPWRWLEHVAWVLFEDVFLFFYISSSLDSAQKFARQQAELEFAKSSVDELVVERTIELKEREALLRSIMEGASEMILAVDAHGIIKSVNRSCLVLTGGSPELLLGRHVAAVLHSVGGAAVADVDWKEIVASDVHLLEGEGLKKTGEPFPIEVSINAAELSDGDLHVLVIRDTSERKIAERRMSEFYSMVSHELRTPLTSIRGSLMLMESGTMGEFDPDSLELIVIARESSDRLIRLINNILDLRKMEAGQMHFDLRPVRAKQIADRAFKEVGAIAGSRKITLSSAGDLDCEVLADEDSVFQVAINLLSNAMKFSPENSPVHFEAKHEGEFVRFTVVDRGPGICEKDFPRLFVKFQQLDSGDDRKQPGTGLGLAICKEIVEAHGGEIGVVSQPGEGASFWFTLKSKRI